MISRAPPRQSRFEGFQVNDKEKADVFEAHRPQLEGLAYRMLGSLAEAQDVVQETWLRWQKSDASQIRSAKAWLMTACSRVAMDVLKSARVQRESYPGPWLPEPLVMDARAQPDRQFEIDDTVSVALMLALEKLSPPERAAFLLHDVFGYGFDEVAAMLDRSDTACRKLASRARSRIRDDRPRFEVSADDHRRLLDSFLQAAHRGDLEQLKRLMSDSVELHSDGGGKVSAAPEVISGDAAVAGFFCRVAANARRSSNTFEAVSYWYNGTPGVVIYENGKAGTAFSLRIEAEKIRAIYALRNPAKLAAFDASAQAARSNGM